jgi:hypothetical protein
VTARPSEPAPSTSPKRQRADQTWKVLPKSFQFCPNADLVVLISDMLSELVALNDRIPLSGAGLTRFHSRSVWHFEHALLPIYLHPMQCAPNNLNIRLP